MTDLPNGWINVALQEIAKWGSGGTPKGKNPIFYGGEIPWAIIGDLNDGTISQTAETITEEGLANSSAKWVPENSVLIAMYGSIGKLGINTIALTTNQAIAFAIPDVTKTTSKFLYFSLMNERPRLVKEGKGATQQNISQTILKPWVIALPPLAEQERIVEILEEQFSRLDSALASVKLVREKAKAFRRSLLHSAFSGEMTGGTEGWREVALGEVADLSLGVMLDKKKETGLNQVPYLANINVRWGAFDLTDLKEMQVMPQQAERAEIRFGDVVACEGGEPARAAVWLSDKSVAIQKALHRIRPRPETSPFFILYFLEKRFRGAGDDPLFTGTTIKHLPKEKLKDLVLPFPPLATQERIVSVLEEQFSRLDNALEVANQLEARIASERRSLLHAAFTGALTATWRETHV